MPKMTVTPCPHGVSMPQWDKVVECEYLGETGALSYTDFGHTIGEVFLSAMLAGHNPYADDFVMLVRFKR